MRRKEINERSPLRVLEQSIHGGLGEGKLGVVVARHGVGKTAFLVGVALDDLMRNRKVLHVSLDKSTEKVQDFYDEIFNDLVHTQHLENVWKVRLEMERNRRIHCYTEGSFTMEQLRGALKFMRRHGDFVPATIVIDGYDFEGATLEGLSQLRQLAAETDAELWMTAVTTRDAEVDDRGVPETIAQLEGAIDVILSMIHEDNAMQLGLHKDHDNPHVPDLKLALDPRTMLLITES